MVDNPMIAIERGIRSGYGVFADGKLAVATSDADGALVGVADLLGVSLLEMVRADETLLRRAVLLSADVAKAAEVIAALLIGVNATDRKISGIKAIRALTGCALKPAKDALEAAFSKGAR